MFPLLSSSVLSRVGESVVRNAGHSDWIAKDREDYIRKAKKFASDLQSLSEIRHSLRKQVTESPIFDGSRFAEDFRAAAWGMWDSINK